MLRLFALLYFVGGDIMPRGSITMQVANFQQLLADIRAIEDTGKKAISNTVKDVKSRAPGWIASEVVKVYNIRKGEVTPSTSSNRMAGSLRIAGETLETLTFTYEGRLLTPVHFGMTPKSPPKGKNYTLKMQVLKGRKEIIGRYKNKRTKGGPFSERSHNILMGTGNQREGGVNWIPFQRMSKRRTDLKVFKTISMPQMITSERTQENILAKLNEETGKRLQHNLDRALGK